MKKKNIRTNWDYSSLAKHYDLRADYSKILINKILKKIKCKKNYPVADIGAGTAKLTKLLCNNDLIVSAIEPNKNMRFYGEKNTNKFLNVNWSSGTGENTTLKSNSIYCVFFGSSFNTLNYKKAFKEINRILIRKGYFCCMWNHRYLKDVHQKKIEKIIKSFLPNYNYGDRRFDYKKMLNKEKTLINVEKISQRFSIKIKKTNFIKAWKSHGTLKRNCKSLDQFNKIIKSIEVYIKSLNNDYVEVPYDNIAYIARLK
tara:strand:+ start:495 stop:1265 length:771 start_codon:yes stop_codon:yes gene_type:complete